MAKEKKTNAMRLLDKTGIPYRVIAYEVDNEDYDGRLAARLTGLSPDQVFKTLVTRSGKGQLVVCCIPVSGWLDLKALAAASGNKSLDMLPVSELLPLTGYMRGGCSPLGMKKQYPTYFDESAVAQGEIAISAGIRGQQLLLPAADLIRIAGAATGPFAKVGDDQGN